MTTTCIRIYVTTGHPGSAANYAYSKKSSSIAQDVDRMSNSFNFNLFLALWTWSYTVACIILLIQETRVCISLNDLTTASTMFCPIMYADDTTISVQYR